MRATSNSGRRAHRASPAPPACAIDARGLVKTFGETRAVDGLDLVVPTGGVYGVLGPNGAGKTTTIRILATLLAPDGGSARVLGHDVVDDPAAVRRRVSLTGQFASVDEDLTGTENLLMLSRLWGYSRAQAKARARELLAAFDLSEAADRQVKHYSGGMRRRIDLAASIVITPELIFLDEPTSGLDPRSRNHVWELVGLMVESGTTVLLTTQHLDEADHLADRVAVIDRGRVIAEGTPGELKASVGSGVLHVRVADLDQRDDARRLLAEHLNVDVHADRDPAALTARVTDPTAVVPALASLADHGVALATHSLGQPSLDEVFLALTGHPAEDPSPDREPTGEPAP